MKDPSYCSILLSCPRTANLKPQVKIYNHHPPLLTLPTFPMFMVTVVKGLFVKFDVTAIWVPGNHRLVNLSDKEIVEEIDKRWKFDIVGLEKMEDTEL